jgi:hypothetical protein
MEKSMDTASQMFIDSIQKAMDSKLLVTGIFLDLSEVYDVINYKRLLDKLNWYDIQGLINKWTGSYLTNQSQFVQLNHTDQLK